MIKEISFFYFIIYNLDYYCFFFILRLYKGIINFLFYFIFFFWLFFSEKKNSYTIIVYNNGYIIIIIIFNFFISFRKKQINLFILVMWSFIHSFIYEHITRFCLCVRVCVCVCEYKNSIININTTIPYQKK